MASPMIDVYVKLPSGRTTSLQLVYGDLVRRVYEHVAREEDVTADRVVLKYTGKVVKKEDSVGYLGICKETILKAEIVQIKICNVYVKLENGRTTHVTIENSSPVRLMKEQIMLQEGIESASQRLKLNGVELTNVNQTLIEAGIGEEAVLTLEVIVANKTKQKKMANKSGSVAKNAKMNAIKTGLIDSGVTDGAELSMKIAKQMDAISISSNSSSSDDEIDERTKASTKGGEKVGKKGGAEMSKGDKEAVLGSFDARGRNVEVIFSFDTTGSMYSCLSQVRSELRGTVKKLIRDIPNIRISIMAQGDYCDYGNYVIRSIDLTSDADALVTFVENVPATGGGDSPECYEWVLRKAQQLDWSEGAAKALVVIGDCLPHPASYTTESVNWHDELDLLIGMGIKVYGVQAQHNADSKPFYKELAERSGGSYINFDNFSIITEMFLAVCHREASSDQQFLLYCQEINEQQDQQQQQQQEVTTSNSEQQKAKSTDVKKMLEMLKEQKCPAIKTKRYVTDAWWDPKLDCGSPQYSYDAQTDQWSPRRTNHIVHAITSHVVDSKRKSRLSIACMGGRKAKTSCTIS